MRRASAFASGVGRLFVADAQLAGVSLDARAGAHLVPLVIDERILWRRVHGALGGALTRGGTNWFLSGSVKRFDLAAVVLSRGRRELMMLSMAVVCCCVLRVFWKDGFSLYTKLVSPTGDGNGDAPVRPPSPPSLGHQLTPQNNDTPNRLEPIRSTSLTHTSKG